MAIYQVSEDALQELISKSVALALAEQTKHQPEPQPETPQKPEIYERLFTVSDICDRFDVTRQTVWVWRQKGLLKPTKLGNMVRFKEADIQNFLKFYNPEQ
jgi:excisionase family DNA binding protein